MNKLKRFLSYKLILLCAAFLISTQAHALVIDPFTPINSGSILDFGDENSNAAIIAAVETELGTDVYSYYKDNQGGLEEGPFQDSYETRYAYTGSDVTGAEISWVGPDTINLPAYLIVKDGNSSPNWYLFDLSFDFDPNGPWDGKETITLQNFFLAATDDPEGSISHVEIVGTTPVPEPATMLLLGSGLIGLAGLGRKRFSK